MLDFGTFMGMTFEKLIKKELEQNSSDIFPLIFEDQKYWVKQARATQSSSLHKFYYFLFPFEVLLPVKAKTAQDALQFETNKLKQFNELGITTPHIAYQDENVFALEDCGKNINSFIRKRDISKERMYFFIDALLETLAKIHNNGLFHGGAQARNFTFKDDKVYVIDLEDSFEESIDLELLQFRDLLLLLLSLTKTRASFDMDYEYVIEKYIALTNNSSFKMRLKQLASKISWLYRISQIKWVKKLLGRDVKGFFKLIKALKEL